MLPIISWGVTSHSGEKHHNEDAWFVVEPEKKHDKNKGLCFLLADGVSECADGALASKTVVSQLARDYYALPDTLDVIPALQKMIEVQNQWLLSQTIQPLITTLCVLVLWGQRYALANVGDTRCYLLRDNNINCLSVDHNWQQASLQHVLKRALGLDQQVFADFSEGELMPGDRFILVTDGVWEPLGNKRIFETSQIFTDSQGASNTLVNHALQSGGKDNASALVVDVFSLPERSLSDELVDLGKLSALPKVQAGETIDGLFFLSLWRESRNCLLYRVLDGEGNHWLLKTLTASGYGDLQAERALLTEEWLLRRLASHYFPEVHVYDQRRHLYILLKEYPGSTLFELSEKGKILTVPQLIQFGIRLGKAVGILHRRNILHRDIKPENLHWGDDERLRILDFGAACCPGVTEERPDNMPGTPSFMAPELLAGEEATAQTDLYALGVTLYWILTGHYPYGEIEVFQRPNFGKMICPSRYRPDLPAWLDTFFLKAVASNKADRFETAEEFVLALERGEGMSLLPRQLPLVEKYPLMFWQVMTLLSLMLNLVLFYICLLKR